MKVLRVFFMVLGLPIIALGVLCNLVWSLFMMGWILFRESGI